MSLFICPLSQYDEQLWDLEEKEKKVQEDLKELMSKNNEVQLFILISIFPILFMTMTCRWDQDDLTYPREKISETGLIFNRYTNKPTSKSIYI